MKTFTINDILSWHPCYHPIKHLPEGWSGTALDILKADSIPYMDRLWVVLRPELVSEKAMRLLAVWTYRQTLKFITKSDPRCIEAANIAERYALGERTIEELHTAWIIAWEAEGYADRHSTAQRSAVSAAWCASVSAKLAASETAYRCAEGTAHQDKLVEMILMENI